MSQPKVSIVVPIFNAGDYLAPCIETLINQTLKEIEIVLVNDGSTDGSPDVIRSYMAKDPRIVMVDKPNGGYGHSMNRGIERATGEYIGIVEPDDYIELDMYRLLYEKAVESNPRAQVVRSAYWRVLRDSKGEFKYPSPHLHKIHPPKSPFKITDPTASELLFYHPSIWAGIYERQFLKDKNISFREFPGAGWADNPFFAETLLYADRIAYVDVCTYCYRENLPGSSSVLKSFELPLERFHNVQDIVDASGVDSPEIREAMACRGFAYIQGAREATNAAENAEKLEEGIASVFKRMDKDAVIRTKRTRKSKKAAYFEVVEPGYQGPIGGGFGAHLVKEFFFSLFNGGYRCTAYRVRDFFNRN